MRRVLQPVFLGYIGVFECFRTEKYIFVKATKPFPNVTLTLSHVKEDPGDEVVYLHGFRHSVFTYHNRNNILPLYLLVYTSC